MHILGIILRLILGKIYTIYNKRLPIFYLITPFNSQVSKHILVSFQTWRWNSRFSNDLFLWVQTWSSLLPRQEGLLAKVERVLIKLIFVVYFLNFLREFNPLTVFDINKENPYKTIWKSRQKSNVYKRLPIPKAW